MDFACSSKATEEMTRWERIVIKSAVVSKRLCKVMG